MESLMDEMKAVLTEKMNWDFWSFLVALFGTSIHQDFDLRIREQVFNETFFYMSDALDRYTDARNFFCSDWDF